MYDLIIQNGFLLDGTGADGYIADIAIQDGKIAKIGQSLSGAKKTIDATNLTVTPGFIDSHSHSDNSIFAFPDQAEKIEQGITTAIGGQCGTSPAPFGKLAKDTPLEGFGMSSAICKTMGTFLETAKGLSLGSNLATLVGHGALRNAVIGPYDRAPTQVELEQMADLLREGIAHGALGISFGLIYPPSCYAKTDELIYLAKAAAECGGILAAHIRNEGDDLVKACREFLTVIKASGARAVFSHHKAAGKENWGKVRTTLKMIDEANAEGCDIYCDVYPYIASHTSLSARFIPKDLFSGGNLALAQQLAEPAVRQRIRKEYEEKHGKNSDFHWILLASCPAYTQYVGLRLDEIAQRHGKDPIETACDLIMDSKNNCRACYFSMCEEDVEKVLAHPRAMICTDASVRRNDSAYHPRLRGTFPRVLGRYVRERKVTGLPEMIRKITSLPAAVYGLAGKGLLKEGMDADICIFDADTIEDRSDYTACHERAVGLSYVLLSGEVVVEDAVHNGLCKGKILV